MLNPAAELNRAAEPNGEYVADAVVVGGGGSGLAAATALVQRGAEVVVLEKQAELGGTTRIAVGSFTAAGTALQRAAGVIDNLKWHAEDAAKFAPPQIEARNHEPLRQMFLARAADTFDWLAALGLSFHGPSPEPPNRVPRMHNVLGGGQAYVTRLAAEVRRQGGAIHCGAQVESLIRDELRVVGVVARVAGEVRTYRARRGVILAAGDYASSPALLAQYKGPQFAAIEGINPHAHGDGHRLALEAGGRLLNMDVTYGPELRFVPPTGLPLLGRLPSSGPLARGLAWLAARLPPAAMRPVVKRLLVTWQHPEDALLADGAILVNAHGERFTNECATPERELAVARQPGKLAYLLLDGQLVSRYSAWPHFVSTAPEIAYAYVRDYLRLRRDVAVADATLEGLARRRAIPPAALRATVERYNRAATSGTPGTSGQRGARPPLVEGPWVLLGPAKAYFTTTEGGVAIDERLRVLDAADRPIAGLYAAGQNGLGGIILWGHGLHIAWAITSGRLAAESLLSDS